MNINDTYIDYNINFINCFRKIFSFIKFKKELKKNKIFFNLLINKKLIIIQKKKKIINPKVSIISPIYNREKYILRFLNNIQNQNFQDIEIIFIDDYSLDNSIKLIEEYKKKDKRIILIKNKVNKGTFISRNIGTLYSNSKYIILPDPDDLLNKDIIYFCYKYAEKYNYEMIRFNIHKINGKLEYNDMNQKDVKKEIYQPELSTYMFYGNNELLIIDYYIHNKFIQKEIYMKAINSLNNFYFNMYITLWEDTIISYILYRVTKYFSSIKKTGYLYIKNSQSITKNMFKISGLRIKFIFIFIKLLFEYSKNTIYEKDMSNLLFTQFNKNFNIMNRLLSLDFKQDLNFYYNIIIMFCNCSFISKTNKNIFKKFLSMINKKNLNSKKKNDNH